MGEIVYFPERKWSDARRLSAIIAEADEEHEAADYWLTVTFLSLKAAKDAYRKACAASKRNQDLIRRGQRLARATAQHDARFWPAFTRAAIEDQRPILNALRRWRGGAAGRNAQLIDEIQAGLTC